RRSDRIVCERLQLHGSPGDCAERAHTCTRFGRARPRRSRRNNRHRAGDGPYDFVSRYFAPAKGIPEDPVTGGAHCMLAPYWAERLGKKAFRAFQASPRGGEIICRLMGDRVELEGTCVFYLEGEMEF